MHATLKTWEWPKEITWVLGNIWYSYDLRNSNKIPRYMATQITHSQKLDQRIK